VSTWLRLWKWGLYGPASKAAWKQGWPLRTWICTSVCACAGTHFRACMYPRHGPAGTSATAAMESALKICCLYRRSKNCTLVWEQLHCIYVSFKRLCILVYITCLYNTSKYHIFGQKCLRWWSAPPTFHVSAWSEDLLLWWRPGAGLWLLSVRNTG